MEFFEELEEDCEDNFGQEIVETVSKNELFSKYTEKELENMDNNEKEKIFSDIEDKVDSEFIKN